MKTITERERIGNELKKRENLAKEKNDTRAKLAYLRFS